MKIKKLVLCLVVLLAFTACGSKKPDAGKEKSKGNELEQYLGPGEEWVVDGKWKLVINSVKVLDGRNEFSEMKPKQVVCVDYSYENIGCTEEADGFFISPDSVIDEQSEMGYSYPAVEELNYPQSTPVGAKMKNAQAAYGLNNESKKVKVTFSNLLVVDGKFQNYKAVMEANVEK